MYMEIFKLYYGIYSFVVELDTSAEVGENQVTLWYSEKVDLHTIPLAKIHTHLLLKALKEPYKAALLPRLEEMKSIHRQRAEMEIAEIQRSLHIDDKQQRKIPKAIKKQIQRLRKRINSRIRQLEHTFIQQEILILEHDCFNLDMIEADCRIYGTWHYLRTFYFEEANTDNIQTFCREFATHPSYRQEILAGERRWSKRNALFTRNLLSVLGEKTLFSADGSYMRRAREFFRWLDMHIEVITAHPDHQRLIKLDGAILNTTNQQTDTYDEVDPLIRPAVDIFKQLPGVSYRGACQGVSGKIRLGEYELLAMTQHEEYGYIAFGTLSYLVHDLIIALLPQFPGITTLRAPCQFGAYFVLRSTGDNIQFRQKLCVIAEKVREAVAYAGPLPSKMPCVKDWQRVIYPISCPPTSEPGGMLPSRREWLCQSEHIEDTLQLLFHLNHWAKASDTLYYADRQGLYSTKTTLIYEAYLQGCIQPIGYIDGIDTFIRELAPEMAADMASETFIDVDLSENNDSQWEHAARALYQSITGQAFTTETESPQLDKPQIEQYILKALEELIGQAKQTRQPISSSALAALLIMPGDFLNIYWERAKYIHDWDDLDEADLRKLDPEGWSLIAFRYESETARYTFHLPYRRAEQFLPPDQIQQLQKLAGESREYGAIYGRAITIEESEEHHIEELLRALSVNIQSICPRKLERKNERYNTHTITWHGYKDEPYDLDNDEEENPSDDYQQHNQRRTIYERTIERCEC